MRNCHKKNKLKAVRQHTVLFHTLSTMSKRNGPKRAEESRETMLVDGGTKQKTYGKESEVQVPESQKLQDPTTSLHVRQPELSV